MNRGKKTAIIVGSILLTGALGAAAAPPLAVNYAMQELADHASNSRDVEATMNESIESDPEFVAIIPRLQITEPYVAVDTAGEFEKTFNDFPEPTRDIYRSLPGVQNYFAHLKQRDAKEARMVENKTFAKFSARAEARNICRIIEASTPSHLNTLGNEKVKLTNPDNLSVYLDYCGGDAASYKEALSSVVVKRDSAAESAEFQKKLDSYKQ